MAANETVATPASSGVGDINSNDKGSGARFNTGKAPYDLVPLELMAIHYERLLIEGYAFDASPSNPVESAMALGCLSQFQARRPVADLIDVLVELGDGWEDCARVFEYGQKKYKIFNWCKGMAWSIPIACAARHLQAMVRGEVNDPESGLPHRGHVYANICMLLIFQETFLEGDDRAAAGLLSVAEEGV